MSAISKSDSKPKLTAKQHRFATKMATGKLSMADAYRQSYSADNMKAATIRTEASKLMANPHVTSMISTLRGRIEAACAASALSDRDIVLSKLRLLVDHALPSDSVKVRALELLGKSCGVFAEVVEHKEHRSPEQILDDIDKRLAADEHEDDMMDDDMLAGDMSDDDDMLGPTGTGALH